MTLYMSVHVVYNCACTLLVNLNQKYSREQCSRFFSAEVYSCENPQLKISELCSSLDAGSLDEFSENVNRISRFKGFRTLATLNYAADLFNNSSIVSSIEFDRDQEFFAIAGVTKKIKVVDNFFLHLPPLPVLDFYFYNSVPCICKCL